MAQNSSYYTSMGIGLTLNPAVYYGVGYLAAHVSNTDKSLATTMAVYSIASTILNIVIDMATGGKDSKPKTYCILLSTTLGIVEIIQILALREMQLIETLGTAALAIGLYGKILYWIYNLNDTLNKDDALESTVKT